jgi:hypothetical protein
MKLYTSPAEAEVLLDAVKLLRYQSRSATEIGVCDKLISRIERCQDLQYPGCGGKKSRGLAPREDDVKCIDCKYLELSLPYGVCSLYCKMVDPDDSCGEGRPREKGENK